MAETSSKAQSNADQGSTASSGQQRNQKNVEDILSKPIPGPKQVEPDYLFQYDPNLPKSTAVIIGRFLADIVRIPAEWIRLNVVVPNRGPKYYYYHRKYPRALPIDECYMDDEVCMYEANMEYERNRKVDRATLSILRYRRDNCHFWHTTNYGVNMPAEACKELSETYNREETNYFIKYGDMHHGHSVLHAYNKQKHRMIIERRRAQMANDDEKKPE